MNIASLGITDALDVIRRQSQAVAGDNFSIGWHTGDLLMYIHKSFDSLLFHLAACKALFLRGLLLQRYSGKLLNLCIYWNRNVFSFDAIGMIKFFMQNLLIYQDF